MSRRSHLRGGRRSGSPPRDAVPERGATGRRRSPLLSRAVSLLPEGDADRLRLLPDLGEAIGHCGDYRGAIAVLEEAIERPKRPATSEREATPCFSA